MHRQIPVEFNNYLNLISNKYYSLCPEHYSGDAKTYTGYEYYLQIQKDIDTAEKSIYKRIELDQKEKVNIIKHISNIYPKASITQSGNFFYPENGFMSWHTNSGSPGRRIYLSYVEEANKSAFKYIQNNKEIISFDFVGWNMREFNVTKNEPFWHCVYTSTPRMSIGFRVFDNLL
tara:strand:- start:3529 stop:4053 length:525 start_codon:yes stop_codon:yes gene_type:complete